MVNRPSVPEIITVNSEILQTQIRDLLPSQNGFGSELQATNVITPIIDLTAAAEGTITPDYQAQAIGFDDVTAWDAFNTTVTIANSPGFYLVGYTFAPEGSLANATAKLYLDDGLSQKELYDWTCQNNLTATFVPIVSSIIVFLSAGQSVVAQSSAGFRGSFNGFSRQLANLDGTVNLPTGFTPS